MSGVIKGFVFAILLLAVIAPTVVLLSGCGDDEHKTRVVREERVYHEEGPREHRDVDRDHREYQERDVKVEEHHHD